MSRTNGDESQRAENEKQKAGAETRRTRILRLKWKQVKAESEWFQVGAVKVRAYSQDTRLE